MKRDFCLISYMFFVITANSMAKRDVVAAEQLKSTESKILIDTRNYNSRAVVSLISYRS